MIKPINEFFEAVMVMAEDEAVRNNRLALLKQVTKLSNVIGDLRKLSTLSILHFKDHRFTILDFLYFIKETY